MQDLLAANAAYYAAFAAADFAAMSALWAEEDVVCVHPGWPILIGRNAVLESYRNILRNPAPDSIVPREEVPLLHGSEGRVCCVEMVNGQPFAAINIFRRIDGLWRMIQHQASPIAVMESAPAAPHTLN